MPKNRTALTAAVVALTLGIAQVAGASHVPQVLADNPAYSQVVLERLPDFDIADIARTLPAPECRPVAAGDVC